jgi:hypothetical protein
MPAFRRTDTLCSQETSFAVALTGPLGIAQKRVYISPETDANVPLGPAAYP